MYAHNGYVIGLQVMQNAELSLQRMRSSKSSVTSDYMSDCGLNNSLPIRSISTQNSDRGAGMFHLLHSQLSSYL